MTNYAHNINVYVGKDRQNATQMTATHAAVRSLTRRVEGVGYKLFMDNLFSPDLFDNLHTRDIKCRRTVRQIIKEYQGILTVRY
jgi:hypothetical protein